MDRAMIAEIAMRYDTAMSRAFLLALGVEPPKSRPRRNVIRVDRYEGIEECRRQGHGVML